METDFENISVVELDQRLGKFYAEAAPKQNENRSKQMSKEQASEYTQNSFKSIRSAINRHLQDLGRDLEIVRGREFRTSNNILDGKLKKNLQEGLARPTKHKEVITNDEMSKISSYLYGEVNPIVLRFRVWFIIAVHFVSRGLEFHQQLRMNSFVLNKDENGNEYVTLSHETKQKIGKAVLTPLTIQKKRECTLFRVPEINVLSNPCCCSCQKQTQTLQVCLIGVQSRL